MNSLVRQDAFRVSGKTLDTGLYSAIIGDSPDAKQILPYLNIVGKTDTNEVLAIESADKKYVANLHMPHSGDYISSGDILMIMNGFLRILLSRSANSNSLLVTERCNNLCLFCSQPPKEQDDEILLGMAACAMAAFNSEGEIGITGGEPLLYKEKFIGFMNALDSLECKSSLHILTNGRALHDIVYVNKLANASTNRSVAFGIPLYSILPEMHDMLVGHKGAWHETVKGIINATYAGFKVEIRFIPTKHNFNELEDYLQFVAKSFPLASQISIMNMEPKGWARKNWDDLYISPKDYGHQLTRAVIIAKIMGLNVRLFNYPLCFLGKDVYDFAEKSISDWKNYYPYECDGCVLKNNCCGFFSSASGKFLDEPRAIT